MLEDILQFAIKFSEREGADEVESYAQEENASEIFIENNDLKQAKSQSVSAIGIRVLIDSASGFSSVNSLRRDKIMEAISRAMKIARLSPKDRFIRFPRKLRQGHLKGIYDKRAESFTASDAAKMASEMLNTAKSFDNRISVDSGNFTSSILTRAISNSNGTHVSEKISIFSWSIMGMAVDGSEVSSFDSQFGASHSVKGVDTVTTAQEFGQVLLSSLGAGKTDSFQGQMVLTPSAVSELVQEVVAHSINADAIQKGSSIFAGKLGQKVASSQLNVEDDGTNTLGLGSSSFDREGVLHQRNVLVEKGILKKFIYDTRTANKDGTISTGNAGCSASSPPSVATSNFIIRTGSTSLDTLTSEIKKGIYVNRFSGNVNPINGDFSGVVKGGQLISEGNKQHGVKELMVAGNVFELLKSISGISRESKVIYDAILPYMRFENISFTSGK